MNVVWMNHVPKKEKTFLSEIFPDCAHFNDFSTSITDGALVILASGTNKDIDFLKDYIQQWKWVVIACIGSSLSSIRLDKLHHSNFKIWITEPHPEFHRNMRRLPAAFMWYTLARTYPSVRPVVDRVWDWAFCGQLMDRAWASAIRNLPNGNLQETCGGLQENYDRLLASAKVIPCRPSYMGPETARVYEALEMGCIPITAYKPTCDYVKVSSDFLWKEYWTYVLGERPPFPILDNPDQLADTMKEVLADWPVRNMIIQNWWSDYKKRLILSLRKEVNELQQKNKGG